MFCARQFFCGEIFKPTSNVLNSDVNIALSSLKRRNTRYQNLEKAKTILNCVTNYRPASDPNGSKGGERRLKILERVAQHCFVASFGSTFCVFHLV